MAKEIILTNADKKALEAELEQLKTVGRKDVADKIKVALSFGDLSENSEYDEAKSEQGKLEAKISEIEEMLSRVVILDEDQLNNDIVHVGSKVKIRDLEDNEILEYHIVGFSQADPSNGKISDESPVGKALIGHGAGETVEAETPSGILAFDILEISR